MERQGFIFFLCFCISEIPNFSYMGFFRKCSMFRWSTPLRTLFSKPRILIYHTAINELKLFNLGCTMFVGKTFSKNIF